MEGGLIDERIGNKRGRDETISVGRLEKKPSGMVIIEEYSGDEMINGVKYEEEKTPAADGGGGGGLFDQLIANLVNSPTSNQKPEEKNGDGGGGGGDGDGGVVSNGGEVAVEKDDGGREVEENEEDGGNEDIVAQLPTSLSDVFKIEDTAPATDEASILLHSIIHD